MSTEQVFKTLIGAAIDPWTSIHGSIAYTASAALMLASGTVSEEMWTEWLRDVLKEKPELYECYRSAIKRCNVEQLRMKLTVH